MRDGAGLTAIDLIRDGYAVGMTARQISVEYDIPYRYVYISIWRMEKGRDYFREIDRKTNLTIVATGSRKVFNGGPLWGRPWTDDEIDEVMIMRDAKMSLGKIARQLDRSRNAVSGMVHRLKARGINV